MTCLVGCGIREAFDVYSIGDGMYMYRVMNAIAMLNNDGVFYILGAISVLMGLMLTSAKAVASGGQRWDIGSIFLSLILYGAMFGTTTTITIHDLGGAPGVDPGGTYTVDNVPFGVGAAGSMISRLGYNLALKMDTAFGLPSGSNTGLAGAGFGNSLAWINAVRLWVYPEVQDQQGVLDGFKQNVNNYMSSCFTHAMDQNKVNLAATLRVEDPWTMGSSSDGGIGVSNQFDTMEYITGGSATTMDCNTAFGNLSQIAHDSSLVDLVANAIASKNLKLPQGADPATALRNSFSDIGAADTQVLSYATQSALRFAISQMATREPSVNGFDFMSGIMISQAEDQRATQWGAEETLFRRVARPMTAFFESVIYACAPFMALVLGFGMWGVGMLVKYLVLTIWVMLWLPVLSIINLFQMTMVEHAYNAMYKANLGLPQSSISGVHDLQMQVMDWMGTGALLASSTPAITLFLIFGGALAATSIMGRMQGGDHVDEKLVSPDVAQNQPNFTGNPGRGVQASGTEGTDPKISLESAAATKVESAERAMNSSAETVNAAWKNEVTSAARNFDSSGREASAGSNWSTGNSDAVSGGWAKNFGVSDSSSNDMKLALVSSIAASGNLGLAASQAKGLGLQLGAAANASSSEQFIAGVTEANKSEGGRSAKGSYNREARLASAIVEASGRREASGTEKSNTFSGGSALGRAIQDYKAKESSFSDAVSMQRSIGSSQSMGLRAAAHGAVNSLSQADQASARANAQDLAGNDAWTANRTFLDSGHAAWADGATGAEKDMMANIMSLNGTSHGVALRSGYTAERSDALLGLMQGAGFAGTSGFAGTAQADAMRNSGVASGVDRGSATEAVGGRHLGAVDYHAGQRGQGGLEGAAGAGHVGAVTSADSDRALSEYHQAAGTAYASAKEGRAAMSDMQMNHEGVGGNVANVMNAAVDVAGSPVRTIDTWNTFFGGSYFDAQPGTKAYEAQHSPALQSQMMDSFNQYSAPSQISSQLGGNPAADSNVATWVAGHQVFQQYGTVSPDVMNKMADAYDRMTPNQQTAASNYLKHGGDFTRLSPGEFGVLSAPKPPQ